MPFELVMYLCVGIVVMMGVFAMDWFCTDQITGETVYLGLLMVLFWPFGLVCLMCVGISTIFDGDFVIARRKR